MLQRQIYPPQVTLAAFQLGYPKEQLPITVEEAESVYGTVSLTEKEQNIEIENEFSMRERLIEIKDASFSHKLVDRSKKQIVKNINIDIYKNDLIALIGNNGAGKSTLMRLLTGLVKPEDGEIVVQGQNTRYCSPEKLADVVTYIYQNPEEMFIEDCVRRDVEFFLKARKVPGYEEQVDKVLKQFELTELQEKDSRLMSGGQQRRASLAIGVAMNPSIILLDEPTANLDMATRKYITKLINSLKEQVGAVLIATHDMQLVAEWANRIIVLHEGEVIHDGNRESVFQNYALLEKAGLKVPQILELSRRLKQKNLAYTVQDFVQSIERKERLLNGVH